MAEPQDPAADADRVVIKKYANRRLYNTATSSYVTLEHLADMVKKGVDFVVFDAKTNENITRTVLTQIIFEEESQGQSLLPIQFLRQLIGFYGNSMQAFLPSYLEQSLASFAQQQERVRSQFSSMAPGAGMYDEQIRHNLALFDRAMKMFSPFAYAGRTDEAGADAPGQAPAAGKPETGKPETGKPETIKPETSKPEIGADEALTALRRQMAEMQAQIEKLAAKG